MKFLSTTAGGYTLLIAVGVIGFLVIHRQLKQDVKDTSDALAHPLGQAFDDWLTDLVFGPNYGKPKDDASPNVDMGGGNFGLTDPNW